MGKFVELSAQLTKYLAIDWSASSSMIFDAVEATRSCGAFVLFNKR